MWLKRQEPTKFTPCSAGRAASPVCATIPIQTAIPRATIARQTRVTGVTLRLECSGFVRAVQNRFPPRLELLRRQPDVGVAAEAAREHPGRLDRRRLPPPSHCDQ